MSKIKPFSYLDFDLDNAKLDMKRYGANKISRLTRYKIWTPSNLLKLRRLIIATSKQLSRLIELHNKHSKAD